MRGSRVRLFTSALLLLAGGLAVAGSPALAQATQTIETVTVTAEKRVENLHDVAIAATVVDSAALQNSGVVNADFLGEVVPTLNFKKGTSNINSTVSLRGIGTQSFAAGAEPSVSTVVDGVVYARSGMAFSEFVGLDHIEVLPGPQGTLFGKNASAGVVNIVTKGPTRDFQGDAQLGYNEGNELRATMQLSGPLTDTLGFYIGGVYSQFDGNVRNVFNNTEVNGYQRAGLRTRLVWTPTDDLKFTLNADYVRADDNCCTDVIGNFVPNAELTKVFFPSMGPAQPGPHNRQVDNNLVPYTADGNGGVSGQVDYSFDGYTLTSITAWRNWYNLQQRDGDFHATAANYVDSNDIQLHDRGSLAFNQTTEELRLASPTDQFIDYVVGAFYYHTDEKDKFTRTDFQCTASTLAIDGTGFRPCSTAPGVSTFLSTAGTANFDTRFNNESLFGQATMHVSERFRLIGGLRYIHDEVNYTFARIDQPTTGPGIGGPFSNAGATHHNDWSYKGGAQVDITPDIMAYATYSHGYKGPAFNVFFNMAAANTGAIAPETVNSEEIGIKNTLFGNTLMLNAAAWYAEYNNFQANSFVTVNGAVTTNLTNAGRVRTQGVEADFTWLPVDDLRIDGGYAYTYANIVAYNCPSSLPAANLATCVAHDGKPLPFAPKHKLNLSADWLLPFSHDTWFDTHFIPTLSYTSRTNFDIDQSALAQQAGYALLGATLRFATKDDQYAVSLIGRNLTNQFYTTFVTPVGNGVAAGSFTRLQIPRDAVRYFGINLEYKF